MKPLDWVHAGFVVVWGLLLTPTLVFAQLNERVWNFDRDTTGTIAAGFTSALTGRGTIGQWVVTSDPSAPSPPKVLAQTTKDTTDYRFPLAIVEDTSYRDLVLSVKFKTISGRVDQGAGLIFRLKDKDNYYIMRANALEDNFRLYHVVNGRRVQFAGANFKVTPQTWHQIKVEARGDEFQCSYDGQLRFTAKDNTFKDAGRIGLWTKADSVIYFDDLTVKDLSGTKSVLSSGHIVAQKLIDDLAAKHPEFVRIGLHVTPPDKEKNIIVASNIPAKIGQTSDSEDLTAMKSGTPVVLKEGEYLDVTLPLHDSTGKLIGAVGLTLKPGPGEREADAIRRARATARELERQIPSKARLFDPTA
ncbi:MAG: hypothetical protein DMG89_15550 [Acidobacteria bacterium]|nr:MAG: hypothetical protein DMG89_15550 [Acidobacteriota bacterium]